MPCGGLSAHEGDHHPRQRGVDPVSRCARLEHAGRGGLRGPGPASHRVHETLDRLTARASRRVLYLDRMTPASPQSVPRDARDVPLTTATLREIGLFGALSDEILEHLTRTLTTARVGPGDTIFRE